MSDSEFVSGTAMAPMMMTQDSVAATQTMKEASVASETADLQPMMTAARVTQLTAQVDTLRKSIEAGDLYLDPAAGEEIKAMLQEQMERVDGWLERANTLARRAPFGANPVGEAMGLKFEDRAAGEGISFRSVFTPYREVLEDAHEAVSQAMNLYQQIEQDNVDSFKRIRPDENQAV
ncbi:hypothetical protein FHR81_003106 [Actinoalloteichus hoggarensis]|uniref:Uncharacterized protein n=1 Tax=Actinoalloteichus hoggarensis TaxID=1470176 RepID=A0A221W6I1_9PSEU|nr:hypothetical protein [Actinoalloteichus hoggarensis]ASO21465.1 hypothetical protein AHOG_19215 [Actinoalloteichus hoggarensis]MBB5922054.1 hypothetical protein [Actinoalloteichus hoggarensis]